jgi:hypothetical protein
MKLNLDYNKSLGLVENQLKNKLLENLRDLVRRNEFLVQISTITQEIFI